MQNLRRNYIVERLGHAFATVLFIFADLLRPAKTACVTKSLGATRALAPFRTVCATTGGTDVRLNGGPAPLMRRTIGVVNETGMRMRWSVRGANSPESSIVRRRIAAVDGSLQAMLRYGTRRTTWHTSQRLRLEEPYARLQACVLNLEL